MFLASPACRSAAVAWGSGEASVSPSTAPSCTSWPGQQKSLSWCLCGAVPFPTCSAAALPTDSVIGCGNIRYIPPAPPVLPNVSRCLSGHCRNSTVAVLDMSFQGTWESYCNSTACTSALAQEVSFVLCFKISSCDFFTANRGFERGASHSVCHHDIESFRTHLAATRISHRQRVCYLRCQSTLMSVTA